MKMLVSVMDGGVSLATLSSTIDDYNNEEEGVMENCTGVPLNFSNYDQNGTQLPTEELPTRNTFIMAWWQQVLWIFVFFSMVVVATGGNLIVIWIVLAHKRMRTVTNYFLVNLSLADTMVSTLNVVFNFVYMLNSDWPFGAAYCKISNFIAIVSVASSVFTLMAIAIDRYVAIMHPLKPRMSRITTLNITLWIWIASSLLSLPNILYSTTIHENFTNGDFRVICYMEWPDGPSSLSDVEYVYNICILILTYMLPITSMTFTYFRVGRELWGSQTIGECTAKQVESVKSKRKIVKMMMVVVMIFTVCWLPYHVYFLVCHHHPWIMEQPYAHHTYLTIYWLAMSNSMYNPIIYCWMNSRFRHGFKQVFFCCCRRSAQVAYDQRQQAQARYSCSEPYADTKVTFNGNVCVALHTVTDTVNYSGGTTSTGGTPCLATKFGSKPERLSNV